MQCCLKRLSLTKSAGQIFVCTYLSAESGKCHNLPLGGATMQVMRSIEAVREAERTWGRPTGQGAHRAGEGDRPLEKAGVINNPVYNTGVV